MNPILNTMVEIGEYSPVMSPDAQDFNRLSPLVHRTVLWSAGLYIVGSTHKGVNQSSKYVTQVQDFNRLSPLMHRTVLRSAGQYIEGSTHKGVNQHSKYITEVQQQRPESPTVTLTWHECKYKVHELLPEVHPQEEFMCLVFKRMPGERCTSGGVYILNVFTRMPGESYHRQLRSLLLYLCYVF